MENITPMNAGGGTTALNVVPACLGCNAHKDRPNKPSCDAITIYGIERVKTELAKALGVCPGELIKIAGEKGKQP